jgi:hypothetical protein
MVLPVPYARGVASTRTTGFDWPKFWAEWDGWGGKIDFLAEMADVDGDWLEQYLRDEIERRRSSSVVALSTTGPRATQSG